MLSYSVKPYKVDQSDYVDELNAMDFQVLIVKVASLGLNKKHVGKHLSEITSYLDQLKDSYGVHPAGEGIFLINILNI